MLLSEHTGPNASFDPRAQPSISVASEHLSYISLIVAILSCTFMIRTHTLLLYTCFYRTLLILLSITMVCLCLRVSLFSFSLIVTSVARLQSLTNLSGASVQHRTSAGLDYFRTPIWNWKAEKHRLGGFHCVRVLDNIPMRKINMDNCFTTDTLHNRTATAQA